MLGIVQIQESSSDTLSEKSSVRSSSDSSLRLVLLHEISVSQLMASYAATVAASSGANFAENIFSPKWMASRDSSSKVYSVLPHPCNPGTVMVASSIGIVILGIKMSQAHLVGSHESWNRSIVSFSDKVVKRNTYQIRNNVVPNSISDSASLASPSTPRRSLSLLPAGSRKSLNKSVAVIKSQQPSEDSTTPNGFDTQTHSVVSIGETEEIRVSAEFSSLSNSVNALNQSKRVVKSDVLVLATMTCRPQIRLSPTGITIHRAVAFLILTTTSLQQGNIVQFTGQNHCTL